MGQHKCGGKHSRSYLPHLQQIQNSLARAVAKAPKSCHITHVLRSLHWFRITEHIEYKLLSLTYKVLTTIQPPYLHNLIFVQRPRSNRYSFVFRPLASSSQQEAQLSPTDPRNANNVYIHTRKLQFLHLYWLFHYNFCVGYNDHFSILQDGGRPPS